jgi:hypothetical protein
MRFKENVFFSFQLIGCVIIGYMAWVLATSVTVSRFLDGSLVRTRPVLDRFHDSSIPLRECAKSSESVPKPEKV